MQEIKLTVTKEERNYILRILRNRKTWVEFDGLAKQEIHKRENKILDNLLEKFSNPSDNPEEVYLTYYHVMDGRTFANINRTKEGQKRFVDSLDLTQVVIEAVDLTEIED